MSKRIIQSPGVEIQERDLSLRTPSPAGTTVYTTGFADQGPTDEVVSISSLTEFERIYGSPKTPAERYFYHTVKATLNSPSRLLVNRLPYGSEAGVGFGTSVGVLAYPARVVVNNLSSTNFDQVSGTYVLGRPTQFNLTREQYLKLMSGQLFTWGSTAPESLNSINALSGAAVIIVNKAQTVIDGKFGGYYVGLADNTLINPASGYTLVRSVQTVSQSAASTGLSSYVTIPSTRFDFALSATSSSGESPSQDSLSQILQEKITGFDISTPDFDDTLNIGIFKLRQSVFANDANTLGVILEEGYNGSIGYYRETTSSTGGAPINFFLENVENDSRNIEILVNPYISDEFRGVNLNNDGTSRKKIRLASQQLASGLQSNTITTERAGLTQTVLAGISAVIGLADSVFPIGIFSDTTLNTKEIGNVPSKLTRALNRITNTELFDIDIIAEGGLGSVWTYTQTSNAKNYDDTKTTSAIEALRTSNSQLVNANARTAYNDVFSRFSTFAGPTKDGGRGDILYIADPLRQIFVLGKDNKVINDPSKNFSTDIYWPLRHLYSFANTSYATAYANYLKVFDESSGLYAYVPASGFVAAKMVSTDVAVGPWGAPAGLNRGIIGDAIDVAFSPNQRQRDDLYTVSLNPITTFPDQGIVVFGQKTMLKKPSAFDRVNVRRSFLFLEKATKAVMKFFIFENNTLFTRTQVTNTLTPFFERIKASDGLYDFIIVCDERNNTAEVIDNNELVVDIYLKPVRTAEFIRVNFYATRTDTNFEELLES
jgi:hypothetical protein